MTSGLHENFCGGGYVCFENKTKNISKKQYTPDRIWTINCRQKCIDVSEECIAAIFRVKSKEINLGAVESQAESVHL
jgi:hypothetical protein